jgi:hypothetical protein
MKKIISMLLTLSLILFGTASGLTMSEAIAQGALSLQEVCQSDPFAEGCDDLNTQSFSKTVSMLCNDGTVVNYDGAITASDGASGASVGALDNGSDFNGHCNSYGGSAAFMDEAGSLSVKQNPLSIAGGIGTLSQLEPTPCSSGPCSSI